MAVVFCAFGDSRMKMATKRIKAQAEAIGVYDRVRVFDENDLGADFRELFAKHLKLGTRGFGYWCWKPYVVGQCLAEAADNDIVNYVDAGCHINAGGREKLLEYIETLAQSPLDVLGFQGDLSEHEYTKGDLIDYFGVRSKKEVMFTGTYAGGIFFIKKTPSAMELIRQWGKVFETDFSLVDDTPSKAPNLEGFIEHRHDQAVFSLLLKQRAVITLPVNGELFPVAKLPDGRPDWPGLARYPIHIRRDRKVKWGLRGKTLRGAVRVVCSCIPGRECRHRVRNYLFRKLNLQ